MALAVELGTEVGDGVAAAVGAKVGVVSEAIVGTGVAAAMVAGTAVGADVAKDLPDVSDTVTGKAGTVTFHHVRLLHASKANLSGDPRRFILYEVMAADAWPLAGCSAVFESWDSMNERMVIGKQSDVPRLVDVPVRMPQPLPPKVSSIFQLQRDGTNKYYMDGTNS